MRTRYELGRPWIQHTEDEASLDGVVTSIRKNLLIRGVADIKEMSAGDDRVAILVPIFHADPIHSNHVLEPGDGMADALGEIIRGMTSAGISRTLLVEGVSFSYKKRPGVHVDMYGAEESANHEYSSTLLFFLDFLKHYFRSGALSLQAAVARGGKASDILFTEFASSASAYKYFSKVGIKDEDARREKIDALRTALASVIDGHLPTGAHVPVENMGSMVERLVSEFDMYAIGRRNAHFAQNLERSFKVNGRKPAIIFVGAGHFTNQGPSKDIRVSSLQDEVRKLGMSYVVLTPNVVSKFMAMRGVYDQPKE